METIYPEDRYCGSCKKWVKVHSSDGTCVKCGDDTMDSDEFENKNPLSNSDLKEMKGDTKYHYDKENQYGASHF